MSATGFLVAVFLAAAAAAVAWPLRSSRARRRAVLGPRRDGPLPAGAGSAADGAGRAFAWAGGSSEAVTDARGEDGAREEGRGERRFGLGADPHVATHASGHARSRPDAGQPGFGRQPGPPGRRDPRRPGAVLERPGVAAPGDVDPSASAPGGARGGGDGAGVGWRWLRLPGRSVVSPRGALLLAGVLGAASGGLLGGPVAAVVVGAYGALGARALVRRRDTRLTRLARRRSLDQLCALAADLRAGVPVLTAAATVDGAVHQGAQSGVERLGRLARAAVRLADRTGAPLADLVERIEADARAADRGLAAAAAQAAGARATAWLLAALPLGGIALGYGVGVDPVAVLLHTPVGAACAVAAVVLQIAGLFWAERLGATPGGSD
ncbi:hypothetical protein ACFY2R_13030 [Micromonospora olivasterospora]|uniref:Tight adherence protein B n=1 Tax=Micromonospora olivasterospora TaxID=1880 RepID=A0A562IAB6_MICOL|nr:tight adherence protein B [Micromonospora olivasterospora]